MQIFLFYEDYEPHSQCAETVLSSYTSPFYWEVLMAGPQGIPHEELKDVSKLGGQGIVLLLALFHFSQLWNEFSGHRFYYFFEGLLVHKMLFGPLMGKDPESPFLKCLKDNGLMSSVWLYLQQADGLNGTSRSSLWIQWWGDPIKSPLP